MAGMDWFRWHHGSVTDPKFALVARKAGASVPDVLAVWAYILETASQSVERGDFGTVDCEALDCVFGFPTTETRTADILAALAGRGLTEGTRITAWEKRQPKREREDATNADRQAAFRAKQNQVTPDNANDSQKKPRGDKSRGDKKEEGEGSSPNGSRIPADWVMDSEDKSYCQTTRPDLDPDAVALDFVQHWKNTPGAKGRKLNWRLTWQTWVRNQFAKKTSPYAKPAPNATVPGKAERDPELTRLDIERKRAVPMPPAIREQMEKLKLGAAP
jgi:hypothetical protein